MPKQSSIKKAAKGINKNTPSLGDLKDLEKEVAGYFDTSNASVNILVLVDNTASNEVSAEVRNLFSTKASYVKLQISYFDAAPESIDNTADMAVVVGGDSAEADKVALMCRNACVPVYIVIGSNGKYQPDAKLFGGDYCMVDPASEGSVKAMQKTLASWIAAVCIGKKFAFAKAFPFVATPIALEAVHTTALENAAIGFVPFLKGADFPLMFVNQLKMLGQIAAVYGVELDMNLLKEAAGVLVVALFGKKFFKLIHKIVPIPASFIGAPVSLVTTEVIGRALVEYFEAGGDLNGVVKLIQKTIEKGGVAGKVLKPVVTTVAPAVAKVAKPVVSTVAPVVVSAAKPIAQKVIPVATKAAKIITK